jgi:hypothetical protein
MCAGCVQPGGCERHVQKPHRSGLLVRGKRLVAGSPPCLRLATEATEHPGVPYERPAPLTCCTVMRFAPCETRHKSMSSANANLRPTRPAMSEPRPVGLRATRVADYWSSLASLSRSSLGSWRHCRSAPAPSSLFSLWHFAPVTRSARPSAAWRARAPACSR